MSRITREITNLAPMTKYVVFLVRTVFKEPPGGVTIGPVALLLPNNTGGQFVPVFQKLSTIPQK